MAEPDKGNPGVYRTYQGRYSATTSGATPETVTVMRTINNVVCLAHDLAFAEPVTVSHTAILALPAECRPGAEVCLPVGIELTDGTSHLAEIEVSPEGPCYLNQKYYLGDGAWEVDAVHLNGVCFSIADRWY